VIALFQPQRTGIFMTYNFDPDRWYDNELAALERKVEEGLLDKAAFEKQKNRLLLRYDDMIARLDGTYQIHRE
jgi:hypothetical protein